MNKFPTYLQRTPRDLLTDPSITNEDIGNAVRELAVFSKQNDIFKLASIYSAKRQQRGASTVTADLTPFQEVSNRLLDLSKEYDLIGLCVVSNTLYAAAQDIQTIIDQQASKENNNGEQS